MSAHRTLIAAAVVLLVVSASAFAQVINLDLKGKAGVGLLAGNETSAINGTPGSGGEVGPGITYDLATNLLTINVAWGSGNGFANLTGAATIAHIHGATASGPDAAFNESASPIINLHTLPGFNSSATAGGITGVVALTDTQEQQLLQGRHYINVHTTTNAAGEIRGQLVPEPASLALLGLGAFSLLARRRRAC